MIRQTTVADRTYANLYQRGSSRTDTRRKPTDGAKQSKYGISFGLTAHFRGDSPQEHSVTSFPAPDRVRNDTH